MTFPFQALRRPANLLVLLGFGFWWLLSQLPHPAIVVLARLMAYVTRIFAKHRCAIVRMNLALCFPELSSNERERLLRKNLLHTALAGLETGVAWFWRKQRLLPMGRVIGMENLAGEQGALLLSLHNTTIDSASAAFNPRASRADMMYRPHNNPIYEYFQIRGRQRHNSHSLCVDRADLRTAVRRMRAGRWLWYAADQDYGRAHSVFAPFFGVEAATITAASRLVKLAKVPVLPWVHYRDEKLRWVVEVQPPLEGFPSGDERQDALIINQWLEQEIRKRPEQYLWVHRRFKTRPDGEPDLYGKHGKAERRRRRRRR